MASTIRVMNIITMFSTRTVFRIRAMMPGIGSSGFGMAVAMSLCRFRFRPIICKCRSRQDGREPAREEQTEK